MGVQGQAVEALRESLAYDFFMSTRPMGQVCDFDQIGKHKVNSCLNTNAYLAYNTRDVRPRRDKWLLTTLVNIAVYLCFWVCVLCFAIWLTLFPPFFV